MTYVRRIKLKSGTYLAEVKGVRKDGKVRQKIVRYIGKLDERGKIIPSKIERLRVDRVVCYGNVAALKSIADELGLEETIDQHSVQAGRRLLALAMMHCVRPSSLNKLRKYFFEFGLDAVLGMEPEEVSPKRFRPVLDLPEENMALIERKLYERLHEKYGSSGTLFYDITNVYFYGVKCSLAKRGYNTRGVRLPQIQIGLAVDRCGFPVFHRVFPGNVFSSRTLSRVVADLRALGRTGVLVLDRGMSSQKEALEASRAGFEVIVGVPLKKTVKQIALRVSKRIAVPGNRVRLKDGFIYAREVRWNFGGLAGKLVVCLNEAERVSLKESRYRRLDECLRMGKPGKMGKYLKVVGGQLAVDEDAVLEAEATDGLYAIFCSQRDLGKEEIIKAYFERGVVERAFKCLKSVLGLGPIRSWLDQSVMGHIFVCYLAYLLLSVMNHKLALSGNPSSVFEAMEELRRVYRISLVDPKTNREYTKVSTLTKEQESILKALEVKLLPAYRKVVV
jgi:transposase